MTLSHFRQKTGLLTRCCLLAGISLGMGVTVPSRVFAEDAPAASATPAAPAAPAEHPRLTPARDAIVDYIFQPKPPAGAAQTATPPVAAPERHVQVLFSGDGGLMRIRYLKDMTNDNSRGSVIINRAAQEVIIIRDDQKIYTRLVQQDVARNSFLLDMSMQFARKGASQVIGQACTLWDVQSAQGKGTACVTEDGFVLEQDGVDVDGLNGHLKAIRISYDALPASVFTPPTGYQEVRIHAPKGAPTEGESAEKAPAAQPIPGGVGPTTTVPSAPTTDTQPPVPADGPTQ
ncbi:DUF4412 domain-containing protein [Acetobacter sp.]|uniref:DUF4412 domain-containing protein n=1 Tax=Acetobacter sp. TaxID=440 RepID=UPI0039E94C0F